MRDFSAVEIGDILKSSSGQTYHCVDKVSGYPVLIRTVVAMNPPEWFIAYKLNREPYRGDR